MKCLKCSKDIPNGASFCPWCGQAAPKPASQPRQQNQTQSAANTQEKQPAQKNPIMGFFWRSAFLSVSAYMIFNGMVVPGIILLVITLAVICSK